MAIATTQLARLSILQLEMPGSAPVSAGVLLEDPASDRLYLRLRRDWDVIAPSEAAVLSELESDLAAKTQDLGAARVLDHLQDTLSNTLTISEPREVMVEDFERAVLRLYRELVHTTVRPFVTHLPRYSLAVAAGKFLENQEVARGTRLGGSALRAPSDAGHVCGSHRGAIHGASHSRRQPVRVPRGRDRIARRPVGAGGILTAAARTTATR